MAESAGDIFGPINFETNDLTQFTSTEIDVGITCAASDVAEAHGTYGMRVVGDGTNNQGLGIITYADKTEIYVRCYIYLDANITVARYGLVTFFGIYDASTALVTARAENYTTAGTGALDRWNFYMVGSVTSRTATAFSTNAWHYIDLYWKAGTGADGGAKTWVDGNLILNDMDNNHTAYASDNTKAGMVYTVLPNTRFFWVDDIKGATTGPIGAYSEASGTTYIPQMMAYYRRLRA